MKTKPIDELLEDHDSILRLDRNQDFGRYQEYLGKELQEVYRKLDNISAKPYAYSDKEIVSVLTDMYRIKSIMDLPKTIKLELRKKEKHA